MPASIIPCVPLGNTIKYSQYSLYTPNMTYTEMKHLRYFRPEALKKLRVLTGGVSGSDTAHTASGGSGSDTAHTASGVSGSDTAHTASSGSMSHCSILPLR